MKKRNRAWRRHERYRVIQRKLGILKQWSDVDETKFALGKLSKGKVHCSCRMCRYEQFHHIEKSTVLERRKIDLQQIKAYWK